jgi:hypothetical protein
VYVALDVRGRRVVQLFLHTNTGLFLLKCSNSKAESATLTAFLLHAEQHFPPLATGKSSKIKKLGKGKQNQIMIGHKRGKDILDWKV